MDYFSDVEVVPSERPTIITLELPYKEVQLAFDTGGDSLREQVLLALIESLVFDVSESKRADF